MNPNFNYYLTATYHNQEYQRMINGVLKRLHITSYHPQRTDYEQEAHLLMATALCQLTSAVRNDQQACNVYLYQRLFWRLLDQVRADQTYRSHIQLSIDQINQDDSASDGHVMLENIFHDWTADRQFCQCEINHFLQQLIQQLTDQQRRYLELVYLDYSPTKIAERLRISRQAVANLRQRVINCGRSLLNEG